ncbi:MAG TPA: hypothetical protein DF364_06970 [Ruminococcaceae bacterium]|nr:hypothetical protein [Oscillospiraceae bacterium]HCU33566.1 hypothetical protein [Oscillospiraceae bacterium]
MKRYQEKMEKIPAEKTADQLFRDQQAFFAREETAFDSKIQEACDYIIQKQTTIILLAGPSASGKTTTAKKLISHLRQSGKHAERISLDNFYKPREQLPSWKDGSPNFESIDGLDIEYFHHLMQQLWTQKEADFPIFDFQQGRRREKTFHVSYSPDTFLIFEGIHALNPLFKAAMDGHPSTGIYVSVHSDFVSEDGKVLLEARQLRLTRRIIRDLTARNSTATNTLSMWDKVLKGERLYIQPYRPSADIHINTVHGFEPFLYRHKIEEALSDFPNDLPNADVAQNLIQRYLRFAPCPDACLGPDSLIREFYKGTE